MNRAAKKRRAKRRSQQYAAEKVMNAIAHGPFAAGGILRHGKSVTFTHNKESTK